MKFKGRFAILLAIFIATFMTSVEVTIVTTAMPTIISELHGLEIQSWVFAVYLLVSAITTPIYGKLSDSMGRKKLFMFGLLLFIIGSFLCGFAPNMLTLIVFRLIQGIGAGAIMPLTFTIIADLFKFEERAGVLAFNNTAWAISALAGPLLGGWIVDTLGWHWVFFINVPLGLITIALTAFGYRDVHQKSSKITLDWSGILSLAVVLISLLLIFQELSATPIKWWLEGLLLLAFVLGLIWFIWSEKRAQDPIFNLQMFKNRQFTIQILVALLLSGALIGFNIYFPIWLQSIYKVPAFIAGLTLTPSSVMWMACSFAVGFIMRRFVSKYVFIFITDFVSLLVLPLIFATVHFPMFYFYIIAGLMGGNMGIILTMSTLIAQNLVPKENVGQASSMIVLGRTVGQAMMTGVFGLAFSLGINAGLKRFPNLSYSQVNEFVSSTTSGQVPEKLRLLLEKVVLGAVHSVFGIVLILTLITLIVCCFEKAQKLEK